MKKLFAKIPTGEEIYSYTIKGDNTEAEILDYGATLRTLLFCEKDVICGYDTIDKYLINSGNHGGIIGRVANRIKNAALTIEEKEYKLTKNDGEHCLHGGTVFNHAFWIAKDYTESSVTLTYVSHDGEAGFPGNLFTEVTYSFEGDALVIDYKAMADDVTPIALTNHAYFNLDGIGGSIKDHTLKIWADRYTEIDSDIIPTGNRPLVEGTIFDFRNARKIGDGLSEGVRGYDHNFILRPEISAVFASKELGLVAELENSDTKMSVYTDQPGIQIYTANHFDDETVFKGGVKTVRHGAVCLETQTEPNAASRGEILYDPGTIYTHTAVYKFERKTKI